MVVPVTIIRQNKQTTTIKGEETGRAMCSIWDRMSPKCLWYCWNKYTLELRRETRTADSRVAAVSPQSVKPLRENTWNEKMAGTIQGVPSGRLEEEEEWGGWSEAG